MNLSIIGDTVTLNFTLSPKARAQLARLVRFPVWAGLAHSLALYLPHLASSHTTVAAQGVLTTLGVLVGELGWHAKADTATPPGAPSPQATPTGAVDVIAEPEAPPSAA